MAASKKTTKPLLEAPVADVVRFAQTMSKLLAQVEEMTAEMPQLSAEERTVSLGRFREDEHKIVAKMLDVVDAFPGHFSALAATDRGKDDQVVETGPARDDLARREAILEVSTRLSALGSVMADAVLMLGNNVRMFTVPAYRIGQVSAKSDVKIRSKMNPIAEFYTAGARKAQRTVKKKRG